MGESMISVCGFIVVLPRNIKTCFVTNCLVRFIINRFLKGIFLSCHHSLFSVI